MANTRGQKNKDPQAPAPTPAPKKAPSKKTQTAKGGNVSKVPSSRSSSGTPAPPATGIGLNFTAEQIKALGLTPAQLKAMETLQRGKQFSNAESQAQKDAGEFS
jgi:hypothetical protein